MSYFDKMYDFVLALRPLYSMFKSQCCVDVEKISILVFFSKIINMIVMFIPLKILFLLSGSKNITFLQNIEDYFGRQYYIGGMVIIIVILYILNVITQIKKSKLVKSQSENIEKKMYLFRGVKKSHKVVTKTYGSFCQLLGDIFLFLSVGFALFFIDVYFAIFYFGVFVIYLFVMERWAFPSTNGTGEVPRAVDRKLFIRVSGSLGFLILFLGLVILVLNTDIILIVAVLILILVKLGNGALMSFFKCQIKIRDNYL
jgi:hypothetical protein